MIMEKRLEDNQAIVRFETPFGLFNYFLVTAEYHYGRYRLKSDEIDIDEWMPTIKGLKVDYSSKKVTGYCSHGTSFRKWWKSLNPNKRVDV